MTTEKVQNTLPGANNNLRKEEEAHLPQGKKQQKKICCDGKKCCWKNPAKEDQPKKYMYKSHKDAYKQKSPDPLNSSGKKQQAQAKKQVGGRALNNSAVIYTATCTKPGPA